MPRNAATIAAIIAQLTLAAARVDAQDVAPEVLAAARALHDEAVVALDARDYAVACPKLEQVVRMIPHGLGAKMTLAECYEGAGRLASAWATYVAVEEGAAAQRQTDRVDAARSRAAALKPRLAQLTVIVPDALRALSDLQIRRDGVPVEQTVWGAAIPVDRGEHGIVATATGKRAWEMKVTVEADGAAVSVEIGLLEDDAPAVAPQPAPEPLPPAPPPPALPSKRAPPPVEAEAGRGGLGAQRVAGLIVGGAGLAALGVGTFFGFRAIAKKSDSEAGGHCHDGNVCDDVGFALRDEGYAAGNISTALFIVGGVAVAGGVTLFLTAPPRERGLSAQVGVSPGGLLLRGRW